MTFRNRNHRRPRQEVLNNYMRREDVKKFIFQKAIHSEPATPAEVKEFLATAPEEVFVLLDSILPSPSPKGFTDPPLFEDTLTRAIVGFFLSHHPDRRQR